MTANVAVYVFAAGVLVAVLIGWLLQIDGPRAPFPRWPPSKPLSVEQLRAAYPEWDIAPNGEGTWQATLTRSEEQPRPNLVACTLAELADALNDFTTGQEQL